MYMSDACYDRLKFSYFIPQDDILGRPLIPTPLLSLRRLLSVSVSPTRFPDLYTLQGRVANPRPVATVKTGRVAQPITDEF